MYVTLNYLLPKKKKSELSVKMGMKFYEMHYNIIYTIQIASGMISINISNFETLCKHSIH